MKIKNTIQLNSYVIISESVERGINFGYKHAHKHTNTPDEDSLKEHIYNNQSPPIEEKWSYAGFFYTNNYLQHLKLY